MKVHANVTVREQNKDVKMFACIFTQVTMTAGAMFELFLPKCKGPITNVQGSSNGGLLMAAVLTQVYGSKFKLIRKETLGKIRSSTIQRSESAGMHMSMIAVLIAE